MKRAKLMQALAAREHKDKGDNKGGDISHFAIFQPQHNAQPKPPASSAPSHAKTSGYLTKDAFAARSYASMEADSNAYEYEVQSENSNLEDWQLHALKPKLSQSQTTRRKKSSKSSAHPANLPASLPKASNSAKSGAEDTVVSQEAERVRKRCEEFSKGVDDEAFQQILSEVERRVCQGKSAEFVEAFRLDWKKQVAQIYTSQSSAKRTFGQQVNEEREREELAKKTWEYQMGKLQKKGDTLKEQLENVRDEAEEYDQALKRLSADSEVVKTMEDLRQVLTVLLASSANVRKAKDKCVLTELSRRADNLLCVACQENQKELVFKPCKHFALCTPCFKKLPQRMCPICRTKIVKYSDVIIP